jgi:hypothetical protein
MAKIAFSKKKAVFTCKLDINLRKKLIKCYIWSIPCFVLKLGHFGK